MAIDIASAVNLLARLSPYESITVLWPLLGMITTLIIYFVVVFELYEIMSKRDPFKIIEDPKRPLEHIGYALEYLFLFPVITFAWIIILATSIAIPAESSVKWFLYNISLEHIFLAVTATTVAIRITAYINQRMSKEMAKLIPLNFLTVIFIELPGIPLNAPIKVLNSMPRMAHVLVYYFIMIFFVEMMLKIYGHYKHEKIIEKHEDMKLMNDIENIKMMLKEEKESSPEEVFKKFGEDYDKYKLKKSKETDKEN